MKNKEFYIKCSCGSEGLYVCKDDDFVYLSYFCFNPKRMNLKDKFRYILNVIKGKPFEDQLVFNKAGINKIIKELSKINK